MPYQSMLIENLCTFMKFNIAFITVFGLSVVLLTGLPLDPAVASDTSVLSEINIQTGSFRDMSWGKHISDCDDMIYQTHKQTSGGNVKIYLRVKERLHLDNRISLAKIEYGFLNSRLLFVSIKTSGSVNKGALKEAVLRRFGDADNNNSESGNMYWDEETTSIIFQTNKLSSYAILMLVSKNGLSANFKD